MLRLEKPFWKKGEFTEAESLLVNALLAAHDQVALRGNISGNVVQACAAGNGCDFNLSVIGALATLGGAHAPVAQIYRLLSEPDPVATATTLLSVGLKVPGWGNSFVKSADAAFGETFFRLQQVAPGVFDKINAVTGCLHKHVKLIYPNPGCYTAATAIALGMPVQVAPFLFVAGRLSAWSSLLV